MNISIDFTMQDLEELMDGKTFDWTYQADTGESINVHLYNEELENEN